MEGDGAVVTAAAGVALAGPAVTGTPLEAAVEQPAIASLMARAAIPLNGWMDFACRVMSFCLRARPVDRPGSARLPRRDPPGIAAGTENVPVLALMEPDGERRMVRPMSRMDRSTRTQGIRLAALVAAAVVGILVAGCAGSSVPAPSGTTTAGFPLGSFSKVLEDPDVGRSLIVWTFTADGRFTEVPIALDGQRFEAFPLRGTFTADGETVTIATNYPPDMGTSTHGWRVDGDRLWTFLVDSTNPEDTDWFKGLDSRPWDPYPS